MSSMTQYAEIHAVLLKGKTKLYTVCLRVGLQSFTVFPPLPLDEAKWMREQLTVALERIVKKRRDDPTV